MGSDSESVSCVDFDRYADSNRNWPVREGLGSVIAHAATGLDIRLQTEVTAIDWSGPRVSLQTNRGSIDCDSVIVTVPTTVLAKESIRFFPALPSIYAEAFAGIPLGVANKVFFTMEDGALPYPGTTNFVGSNLTARTGSYALRPNGGDVLLGYFGGTLARELEVRGELESFAREELQSIFGADFTRRIRGSLHSEWVTDRFAAGSYSVALPGKAHLRAQLSEPVGGKLYFAGEANSLDHFGTIQGAWESAVATAEKTLAALRIASRSPNAAQVQ
jgi:monoamine oxidase